MHFKGAVGALDGTHIKVKVPENEHKNYRNRKQFLSTNVLGVCNFDLTFSYCLAGWEGSAHDSQVLRDAIFRGFMRDLVDGEYYLADAGYGLSLRTLTPFRGVRYHLKQWKSYLTYAMHL